MEFTNLQMHPLISVGSFLIDKNSNNCQESTLKNMPSVKKSYKQYFL